MRALLAALMLVSLGAPALARQPVLVDARFDAIVADARAKMLAEPESAIRAAERARRYGDTAASPDRRELMRATADWLQGEALTRTGRTAAAEPLIARAIGAAARLDPGGRLHADALLSRASIEMSVGKVGEAMVDLHAAHDLFRKLGDTRSRARALALIANLYYLANDQGGALRYYGEALDVYTADPGLEIAIRNGRGVALRDLARYPEAAAEFAAALKLARAMDSPTLIATILNNAARVALAQNRLSEADAAISESFRLARADGGPVARQQALAAQSALQKRDLRRAEALIAVAFRGVDLGKTTLVDREAHETAYQTYRGLGRADLALAHLTALKRLDDEATELARSNGAALMAARFDFANQEVRIANLKADDLRKSVAFERARAQSRQIALIGGVGATLAIIAVLAYALVTVRRSRDKVRAANVDLALTNTALEKALAAKTEFLATTSHEIRTPLNGILGMTQVMLADPKVDGATRDRVTVVHGAGVTMRALVDDILDVAKMETGNLTVEERAFDLRTTLSDATRMWEEQARDKGLAFAVDLAGCPQTILGDPGRLRQIVFNLLSNAVKFTPEGSVALRATRVGDRYDIAVCDTGIGIDPARHEEIFESFRQADATTTRRFGGTGLGLTICRNLARAMGGDVTVESEEGRGATFTVTLPLTEIATPSGTTPDARSTGTIVIDRNPITRAKLRALVEPVAGPVEAVGDVAAAAALMAGGSFRRLLIDDAVLGPADDAADELRRLAVAAAETIVLRRADGASRAALLGAGATVVLDRPIAREALIAALTEPASGVETRAA